MISQVVVLSAVLVAVYANGLLFNTGASITKRQQDAAGNYAFGYDIVDGKGASNSRSEVGDGKGNTVGSYTLKDIDGRARRVDYVADGHGFRASVKTNEPGTALSAPAAALISSPYLPPVAPKAVVPVAPLYGSVASLGHLAPVAPVHLGLNAVNLGLGNILGLGHGLGAVNYGVAINHHGLAHGHW